MDWTVNTSQILIAKKKGKDRFSLWKLLNLGVFHAQRGGLVEKATKAGRTPDPSVTSLFLTNPRRRELITTDSVECVFN